MKILYLSHRIPYPPNKGDKIRSFNEIKYLSSSHEIHLACLADNPADLKHANDLNQYCKKVYVAPLNKTIAKAKSLSSLFHDRPLSVAYFYSNSLQTEINQWLSGNSYDAIICFSSPMAEYLLRSPFLAARFSSGSTSHNQQRETSIQYLASSTQYPIPNTRYPKLIMDFCDLDSDKWLQYSQKTQFPMSLVYKMESRLLLRYEEQINQLFDNSIFVSQQEVNLFQTLFPKAKNISVIPNGVDYNYFSPYQTAINEHLESSTQYPVPSTQYSTSSRPAIRNSQPTNHQSSIVNRQSSIAQHPASSAQYPVPNIQRPILLFTGAMDYHANIEGVTWFCNDVFPAVKSEFPESQFYIVGSKPHPKVRNLGSNDGVRVTGFVEDIRPYYQAADVCVIPLRLARGIQNKVLEAMAMGKAVVTTSKAIEGIRAATGKQVLVEDTPNGFSNMVLTLIKDRETRKRLGTNARQFVMKNYNWSTNMKKLDALLQA